MYNWPDTHLKEFKTAILCNWDVVDMEVSFHFH